MRQWFLETKHEGCYEYNSKVEMIKDIGLLPPLKEDEVFTIYSSKMLDTPLFTLPARPHSTWNRKLRILRRWAFLNETGGIPNVERCKESIS